jgi:hypothetical protein
VTTFVAADGTALKTIYPAGANGSKVVALGVSSNDNAHDIQTGITVGGVFWPISTDWIGTNSGLSYNIPPYDLLYYLMGLPIDSDGNHYLYLDTGDLLQTKMMTAVSASWKIWVMVIGYDF